MRNFFYLNLREAQKYNTSAIKAIRDFWSLFLNPEIKVAEFLRATQGIDAATNKALATYKVRFFDVRIVTNCPFS